MSKSIYFWHNVNGFIVWILGGIEKNWVNIIKGILLATKKSNIKGEHILKIYFEGQN